MKKVLGDKSKYYTQTNNAQVYLFDDYFHKKRPIACGPTAAAMCLDIAGWPMNIFTPGVQPEDSILMALHNPKNLPALKAVRDLNYDTFPPNEVPQTYPPIMTIIYNRADVCRFSFGLNFRIIKDNIDQGKPMMMCGEFPAGGHYVTIVGYDDEKNLIIYNDPYPNQWPDREGYNREMDEDFFDKNIKRFRVEFNKYA